MGPTKQFQNYLRDNRVVLNFVDFLTYFGAGIEVLVSNHHRSYIAEFLSKKHVRYDVPYTTNPSSRHYLDVYTQKSESKSPVIVFVHGGAWGTGRKSMYRLVARRLQRAGFVVMVINYRIWPDATVDGQASDVLFALKWAELNSNKYGGNSNRMYLMGHSSGAHIAALSVMKVVQRIAHQELATSVLHHSHASNRWDQFEGMPVRGVIGLSGVYDIATHYKFEAGRGVHNLSPMKPATGSWSAWDAVSPTLSVPLFSESMKSMMPPFLLLHGEDDSTVPWTSSEDFLKALRHSNIPVAGFKLQGVDHVSVHMNLMFDLPGSVAITQLVEQFCSGNLQQSSDELELLNVIDIKSKL